MATDNKYDRQLRLWGVHGQRALATSKICVLNVGPTGSESLKNLVLPGCGDVTIVDPYLVEEADLANNFFVSPKSLGHPRAQVVADLLQEMNPDVQNCTALQVQPSDLISNEPSFFSAFSIVIGTQLREGSARGLAKICTAAGIPLVLAHSYGLLGYVRCCVPEHCIVEAKPEPTPLEDLRLANPWPELLEFSESIGLETMQEHEHGHVPYAVVLLQLAQVWRKAHGGELAKTAHEKEEFKQMIVEASLDYQRRAYSKKLAAYEKTDEYQAQVGAGMSSEEAVATIGVEKPCWGREINYEEARKFSFTAHVKRGVPYEAQQVLADPKAAATTPLTKLFWVIARALKEFVEDGDGSVPLNGSVPDMTASSDMYIAMQKVYGDKARQDYENVLGRVRAIFNSADIDEASVVAFPYAETVEGAVKLFCKNAEFIQVLRHRDIEDECNLARDEDGDIPTLGSLQMDIMMKSMDDSYLPEQCCANWYLMYRAAQRFEAQNGFYPGTRNSQLAADAARLFAIAKQTSSEIGFEETAPPITENHAVEMTRYGACEIHNIASFIGGITAQEAVKLITCQYVPLNNTYIFNGITGDGQSYAM